MTIASAHPYRPRAHTTDLGIDASRLSPSAWRRVARLTTIATVSIATVAGVSMGLAAPSISPVAPVVEAAAPIDAPAVTADAPAPAAPVAVADDHHHGDGGRGGDDGGRR